MRQGLYSVRFQTSIGAGAGVIYVEESSFVGGDAGYFYYGKVNTQADNSISVFITLRQHDARIPSVFGNISQLDLEMNGKYSEPHFNLAGSLRNLAGFAREISIQATGSFLLPVPFS